MNSTEPTDDEAIFVFAMEAAILRGWVGLYHEGRINATELAARTTVAVDRMVSIVPT